MRRKKAVAFLGRHFPTSMCNRKYRKRIKMMHRQFTRSSEFAGRQEPYRTLNRVYAGTSSIVCMAKAEALFRDIMVESVKASKHLVAPSGAGSKEEQE